jgi:spore germination protein GerM
MKRVVGLLCILAAIASACSIRPQAAPSDLPAERSGVFGEPATGDEAAGENRIFLLAPTGSDDSQRLRSVLRDVTASAPAVLNSLFAGPNAAERDDQMDTAIPADIKLHTARTVGGVLTADVSDVFDDLTTDGLRLAVAQIVITATEIPNVQSVVLRVDGEDQLWPRGNNELTDQPLTAFDYPGLVESSQPPFPAIPSQRS